MKWSVSQLVPLVGSYKKYRDAYEILNTTDVQVKFREEYCLECTDEAGLWKPLIELGWKTCQLCLVFHSLNEVGEMDRRCHGCPVYETTKERVCYGTPFRQCEEIFKRFNSPLGRTLSYPEVVSIRKVIGEEADFLESIIMDYGEPKTKGPVVDKKKTQDEADIKEFKGFLNRSYYNGPDYCPHIEEKFGNRILYIKLPNANRDWALDILQASEKFVQASGHRYPKFSTGVAKEGYMSIFLSEVSD
jgi:hypothetical protein